MSAPQNNLGAANGPGADFAGAAAGGRGDDAAGRHRRRRRDHRGWRDAAGDRWRGHDAAAGRHDAPDDAARDRRRASASGARARRRGRAAGDLRGRGINRSRTGRADTADGAVDGTADRRPPYTDAGQHHRRVGPGCGHAHDYLRPEGAEGDFGVAGHVHAAGAGDADIRAARSTKRRDASTSPISRGANAPGAAGTGLLAGLVFQGVAPGSIEDHGDRHGVHAGRQADYAAVARRRHGDGEVGPHVRRAQAHALVSPRHQAGSRSSSSSS